MMRRLLTIRVGTPPGPVVTCLGRWASAYGLEPTTGAGLTADVWAMPDLFGRASLPIDIGEPLSAFGGSAVGVRRCSGAGGITVDASGSRAGAGPDPFCCVAASLARGDSAGGGRDAGGTHCSADC